jgi:hypothetical protein
MRPTAQQPMRVQGQALQAIRAAIPAMRAVAAATHRARDQAPRLAQDRATHRGRGRAIRLQPVAAIPPAPAVAIRRPIPVAIHPVIRAREDRRVQVEPSAQARPAARVANRLRAATVERVQPAEPIRGRATSPPVRLARAAPPHRPVLQARATRGTAIRDTAIRDTATRDTATRAIMATRTIRACTKATPSNSRYV